MKARSTPPAPLPANWTSIKVPTVPNPWREILSGQMISTAATIDTWCRDHFRSGEWRSLGYNVYAFRNRKDAVLFQLTWL